MDPEVDHPEWEAALVVLPWKVCTAGWSSTTADLRQVCGLLPESSHPLLHHLARRLSQNAGNDYPRVLDLPFDWLVRRVFTGAAARAGWDCRGVRFSHDLLQGTLERLNLDSSHGLAAALRDWVSCAPPAHEALTACVLTGKPRHLCEPGAWLIDAVLTMQCVLSGENKPVARMRCQTVDRKVLVEVLFELLQAGANPDPRVIAELAHNFGPKRRRNAYTQLEHLAWLALECQREELIIAIVWHYRRINAQRHFLLFPPAMPVNLEASLWEPPPAAPREFVRAGDETPPEGDPAGESPLALPAPPPPTLWDGKEPPQLQDALGLTDLAILPWHVPFWYDNFVKLRDLLEEAPACWYPLLHNIAGRMIAKHEAAEEPKGPEPTLSELPYDTLVHTVFTRAADRARLCCRGERFTYKLLYLILQQLDLDTPAGLKAGFKDLQAAAVEGASVRKTLSLNMTATELQHLNRPGAWVLDSVHTVQLVLAGQIRDVNTLRYKVLSNRRFGALMGYLFPDSVAKAHAGNPLYGSNLNNIGNQAEHLAWLSLEADRCELILALAWHTRLIPLDDDPMKLYRKRQERILERGTWMRDGETQTSIRAFVVVNVIVVRSIASDVPGYLSALLGEIVQVLEVGAEGTPFAGMLRGRKAVEPAITGWLPAASVDFTVTPAMLDFEGASGSGLSVVDNNSDGGSEEEDDRDRAVRRDTPAWEQPVPLPQSATHVGGGGAGARGTGGSFDLGMGAGAGGCGTFGGGVGGGRLAEDGDVVSGDGMRGFGVDGALGGCVGDSIERRGDVGDVGLVTDVCDDWGGTPTHAPSSLSMCSTSTPDQTEESACGSVGAAAEHRIGPSGAPPPSVAATAQREGAQAPWPDVEPAPVRRTEQDLATGAKAFTVVRDVVAQEGGYLKVDAGDRVRVLHWGSEATGDEQWVYAARVGEPAAEGWLPRTAVERDDPPCASALTTGTAIALRDERPAPDLRDRGYLAVSAGDHLEVLYLGSAETSDSEWVYAKTMTSPVCEGWLMRSVVQPHLECDGNFLPTRPLESAACSQRSAVRPTVVFSTDRCAE